MICTDASPAPETPTPNSLVLAHRKWAIRVADNLTRRAGQPVTEDVRSAGLVGLVIASTRWRPDGGANFRTFSAWWVRAWVSRHITRSRHVVEPTKSAAVDTIRMRVSRERRRVAMALGRKPTPEEVAAALGCSMRLYEAAIGAFRGADLELGTVDGDGVKILADFETPEDICAAAERETLAKEWLEDAMRLLNDRQREVYRRRCLVEEPETLAEIGMDLGVSRERVRQIQAAAHKVVEQQLKARLRAAGGAL